MKTLESLIKSMKKHHENTRKFHEIIEQSHENTRKSHQINEKILWKH